MAAFRSTPDLVIALDGNGVIVQFNAALTSLLGGNPDRWSDRPLAQFIETDGGRSRSDVAAALGAGRAVTLALRDVGGASVPFDVASVEPLVGDGDDDGVVIVLRDARASGAAARRVAEIAEQLRHAESHDGLTGLPNRCALFEHLDALDDRSGGPHRHLLVVRLCNLDAIRDECGRRDADAVLQRLALAVRSAVRPADFVAVERTSELVVVLAPTTSDSDAHEIGARVNDVARRALYGSDAAVSIGMASDEIVDTDQALDEAGVAARWACKRRRTR